MEEFKAVIYARYSSSAQREESIDAQLRECHKFARDNNMLVINEYTDKALSGKTHDRPGFQRLIKDSSKRKFNAVIMYTLDRFARSRLDSAIYKERLKKNGVHIFYAKQSIPEGPEGIILESVLEGYAEYYSENLSRNVKRGMKENALHCKVNGPLGLGYQVGENSTYEINPTQAQAVKIIFEMYVNDRPLTEIAKYLNDKGYRSYYGRKFARNSFYSILKSDKYIGTYRHGDVVVENGIPAIIDKELFEQAQERLKFNYTSKGRFTAHEQYYLTGKLYCGHCGSRMFGESGINRHGKSYYYYTCKKRKNFKTCNKKNHRKEELEDYIINYTLNEFLIPENIERIATIVYNAIQEESKNNTLLNTLNEQLKENKSKISNILQAIEQGIFTSSTRERLQALEEESNKLEVKIINEENKQTTIEKDYIYWWLLGFKNQYIKNKESLQQIIDTLINSIYIFDNDDHTKINKIVINYNIATKNTQTIKGSDVCDLVDCHKQHTNFLFYNNYNCFGVVMRM